MIFCHYSFTDVMQGWPPLSILKTAVNNLCLEKICLKVGFLFPLLLCFATHNEKNKRGSFATVQMGADLVFLAASPKFELRLFQYVWRRDNASEMISWRPIALPNALKKQHQKTWLWNLREGKCSGEYETKTTIIATSCCHDEWFLSFLSPLFSFAKSINLWRRVATQK